MITEEEFTMWLRHAQPGDWLTYHVGQHLFGLNGQKKTVATVIHRAAETGELFICQKRIAEGEFAYKALKPTTTLEKRMKSWTLRR